MPLQNELLFNSFSSLCFFNRTSMLRRWEKTKNNWIWTGSRMTRPFILCIYNKLRPLQVLMLKMTVFIIGKSLQGKSFDILQPKQQTFIHLLPHKMLCVSWMLNWASRFWSYWFVCRQTVFEKPHTVLIVSHLCTRHLSK